MKLVTDNTTIVFEDYGLIPFSNAYDQTPSRRVRKESVIDRNGELTFIDGLNNKQIDMSFYVTGDTLQVRKQLIREITPELLRGGELHLNFENDIFWKAKVLNSSNIQVDFAVDTLNVRFDCEPLAYSAVSEDTTWIETDISWAVADFTWAGTDTQETFTSGTHTVTNRGNYPSNLVIACNGAGTVTIGSQSFTVTEECIVDTDNMIVYNDSVNKIGSFTGDFIILPVGESTLTTDVEIQLINKDRWV